MLWHIELNFTYDFFFTVLQIKFECRQFASIFVGVIPLLELRILQKQFPHFSLTCFDILSWNFAFKFVLLYYRSSSSVVNLRQFLSIILELSPFWNLQYWKYTVFRTFPSYALTYWAEFYIWLCFTVLQIKFECREFASIFVGVMPVWNLDNSYYTVFCTFLLHALTYWAEILRITLFNCTTDQIWVLSIFRQFLCEFCPFLNLEYWKYIVLRTFLLHALTYWAEILHMTLLYCTAGQVWV